MKYADLVSPENLFIAFDEFKRGKRKKEDVMHFEQNLEENIFDLSQELISKIYRHGSYANFVIWDPKYRIISKGRVRDRVVHHALFNYLYAVFDKSFIFHSYSSRMGKGTHIGVKNLHAQMRKVSENFSKPSYALKCDIRKFFASVNHDILMELLSEKVDDSDILWLAQTIIESYSATLSTGIPLGNVTSQIFANIYLNQLDQFIKHELRLKYYLRYADDFVVLHQDKDLLRKTISRIDRFLQEKLKLHLHPQKISVRNLKQGVDFLGYVCLPYSRVIRTKTKKRMFRKFQNRKQEMLAGKRTSESLNQSAQSYLGMLQHANSYHLTKKLRILSGLEQEYESLYPVPYIPHEIAVFLGLTRRK
ncbi:group II intron reverse transcriptase domain-containing protein [Candidatus Peregrinibacteria bacterium]|nr:group II intron reverse transcriptase domain-containing protein [Candidatus Peregrinibacteria bacterium]